ncbi:purine nucleoside phosphorylase, partial [Kipferlia bialata]
EFRERTAFTLKGQTRHIEVFEGTYCMMSGPSYETHSEIQGLVGLGGGTVGMSTYPEVLAAAEQKMEVLGMSVVTNMGAGMCDEVLTHEDVQEVATALKATLRELFKDLLSGVSLPEREEAKPLATPPTAYPLVRGADSLSDEGVSELAAWVKALVPEPVKAVVKICIPEPSDAAKAETMAVRAKAAGLVADKKEMRAIVDDASVAAPLRAEVASVMHAMQEGSMSPEAAAEWLKTGAQTQAGVAGFNTDMCDVCDIYAHATPISTICPSLALAEGDASLLVALNKVAGAHVYKLTLAHHLQNTCVLPILKGLVAAGATAVYMDCPDVIPVRPEGTPNRMWYATHNDVVNWSAYHPIPSLVTPEAEEAPLAKALEEGLKPMERSTVFMVEGPAVPGQFIRNVAAKGAEWLCVGPVHAYTASRQLGLPVVLTPSNVETPCVTPSVVTAIAKASLPAVSTQAKSVTSTEAERFSVLTDVRMASLADAQRWSAILKEASPTATKLVLLPHTIAPTDTPLSLEGAKTLPGGQTIVGTEDCVYLFNHVAVGEDDVRLCIQCEPIRGAQVVGLKAVTMLFDSEEPVVLTDIVNFTGLNPLRGHNVKEFGPRFPDMSYLFPTEASDAAKVCGGSACS